MVFVSREKYEALLTSISRLEGRADFYYGLISLINGDGLRVQMELGRRIEELESQLNKINAPTTNA